MSDSSSGESSDDSLLASPVFKKRDRRSERGTKSKLSFLDACLHGTMARTDAQRRLAEVESEHIMETKEQDSLDKEDKSSPKSDGNDAATVEAKEAENDNSGSAAPQKANEKTEQQNEEEYWNKVESFNSANKEKMSFGIDADRGRLHDAMDGILDVYNSDTDSEDGKWNDGMGGMTSEQKRRDARAKLQCLSASLGLRRMFVTSTKTKCGYADKAEALDELKAIVATLQKRLRNKTSEMEAILRLQMLDPLNKILKKPKDLIWSLLLRFLQRNKIVNGMCEERVKLPKIICHWMWNVACSSYETMGHMSTACCQNLVKMILNEADIDDDVSFIADLTFVERFSISDLISHLENDCGLWQQPGPIPFEDENVNRSIGKSSPSVDVYAMKNVFLLWKAALDRDMIKLDTNNGDNALFGEAAKAVTALTRAGMDPTFNLANDNTNNCISTLPGLLQSLLSSLISSTIRQISKLDSDSGAEEKWIKYTAECMVDACSNLSSGEERDADHDDDDGWLPLACVAERLIEFDYGNDEQSLEVIEVKLNFAILALKRCLAEDDTSDRENNLKQATAHLKELDIRDVSNDATNRTLQVAMHGLAHSDISLQHIDKHSDVFMRDHPRLLAAVMLSGECAFVGLYVSKLIEAHNLLLEPDEKDALVDLMSRIESSCNNIKKKCTSVIAYPHLRRVKEYLTRLGKSVGSMKGKSRSDKRRKMRTQGSLDSWRRTSLPLPEDTQCKENVHEFSQDSNCSDLFLQSQD